jgi:methoxymalonate biosynthesis acyl carrier protein
MSNVSNDTIKTEVRRFLDENLFAGKPDASFTDDTPLISSRLMDSIVALKLVSHLETTFNIEFEAHEVDQDNLNTVNVITDFVAKKCL